MANTNVPATLTREILGFRNHCSPRAWRRAAGKHLPRLPPEAASEVDGMAVESEIVIPIRYKDYPIDCTYRADIVVEGKVLIELKSVDNLLPLHESQVLTYLRHSRLEVGLLINFNVTRLMNGVRRLALSGRHPISPAPSAPSAFSSPLR